MACRLPASTAAHGRRHWDTEPVHRASMSAGIGLEHADRPHEWGLTALGLVARLAPPRVFGLPSVSTVCARLRRASRPTAWPVWHRLTSICLLQLSAQDCGPALAGRPRRLRHHQPIGARLRLYLSPAHDKPVGGQSHLRGRACHTSARTIAAVGRPRMEAAMWLGGTFQRSHEG